MPLFKLDDVFTYQDANEIKTLWASSSDPAKAMNPATMELEDTGLYQDGEIWLDTGNPPIYVLKRFNGTTRDWEGIADLTDVQLRDKVKDYFIRKDEDDTFANKLTSTKSGAALEFDSGHSMITVHDGSGDFNIKCGVDESNTVVSTDGGSHIRLDDSGGIFLNVSGAPMGSTFSNDTRLAVTGGGVSINDSSVWHGGNDGSGSGLDADKLDGFESTQFVRSDAYTMMSNHTHWHDEKIAKFGTSGGLNLQYRQNTSWIENTLGPLCINNYAAGESIHMTAKNNAGTLITLAKFDPDVPAFESHGAILSKMSSQSLANNTIFDTGIPRGSLGYIFINHKDTSFIAGSIFLTGINLTLNNGVKQIEGASAYHGDVKDENKFNVYCESSGNIKIQNISGETVNFDIGFLGISI